MYVFVFVFVFDYLGVSARVRVRVRVRVHYSPGCALGRVGAEQEGLLSESHLISVPADADQWEALLLGPGVHHAGDVGVLLGYVGLEGRPPHTQLYSSQRTRTETHTALLNREVMDWNINKRHPV